MPITSRPQDTPTGVLPDLGAAVEGLVARVASEPVAGGELLDTLVEVTTTISRLQAVQVLLAEQVDATDVVATTGWASTKDLLTHLTGGRKGTGGGILRLAEHTAALPDLRAAMLTGEVSPAQARTIGRRVTTLPADPTLRTHAAEVMISQVRDQGLDAGDLDRAFTDVLTTIDPDGSLLAEEERFRPVAERAAHHARHLSLVPDEVGGVRISGYAGLEDAELIRTTLTPLGAPVVSEPGSCGGTPGSHTPGCPDPACRHDGRDPRDHGTRLFDALVQICRQAQAVDAGPDELPRAHGTTARIVVTIDHAALTVQLSNTIPSIVGAPGLLGSGQHLSAQAVRRLGCDADLLPAVLGTEGQILDLGRTQRLVSRALWLAVVLRDQHCVFPGCSRPPQACEAHHLVHWADGGPTSLDNLALLCRAHHTLTHHSPWAISIDPDTRRPIWTPPPRTDQHDPRRLPPLRPKIPPHPLSA